MLMSENSTLRLKNANPVVSFSNLRRLIGILGMAMPLICFLGGLLFQGDPLQSSISAYYYTNVRDVFTGIMVAVGIFMITYRGYELIDDIVSNAIAVCALGVALFPCALVVIPPSNIGFFQLYSDVSSIGHAISAGSFFFLLAMNSIFIFTLSDKSKQKTKNKEIRNVIYITSGVIILLALVGIGVLNLMYSPKDLEATAYLFILETILLEAFGISWLVKGNTLFRDK